MTNLPDDPEERQTLGETISRQSWSIGVAALAAWCTMVWLMFGDVL